MDKYPHLFQPGRIGSVELRNRVVMAPMGTTGALVGFNGTFSDRAITYYERRAKGETGLIITGLNLVNSKIEPWEIDGVNFSISFDSFWKVPNFLQLTERVHDFGSKIFAQLTAGWGRVFPGSLAERAARNGFQFVAPSVTPLFWKPEIVAREMTVEEVEKLVANIARAAVIAKESQFDGIELHGHEGYLMDQFTTTLWNKRTDKYGGDLMGRMEFALSTVRAIQEAAGADFPIIYRYGVEHKIPGGRTPEEGIKMAKILEKAGVAALHVDAGCFDNWQWPHPPIYQPPGCMVAMAEMVKPHVKIPVITVGRLGYPDLANHIIERGKADFIALGRPLLADPDFASKARKGEKETIRPCIGCHECLARIRRRQALSCAVNPQCGEEDRLAIRLAPVRKKVMVVGGGIAGMEAARVSAARGHQVTIYEKNERLGGTLHIAGRADFKQDIADLLNYQVREIEKNVNITVKLMSEVTRHIVESENPDVLFLATGSRPTNKLGIRGLERTAWMTPDDVYRGEVPVGKDACVVGGGSVGCETAIYLAQKGWSVVVLEMVRDVAADLHEANREMLIDMLRQHSVKVFTGTQVEEVESGTVICGTSEGPRRFSAELLVLAVGRQPVRDLMTEIQAVVKEWYVVGDCVEPRKIKDAIWEAFKLANVV
jgi:2-enoate reductase